MREARVGPAAVGWLKRLPLGVLLVGALLRIIYAAGTDVRNVYDDHFHVTRIMVNEHRWPDPAEGWQTYQPPLYHWLSGVVYRAFSFTSRVTDQKMMTPAEANSREGPQSPTRAHWAGRKAIQFISAFAGIGTLVLIALTLRLVFPSDVFAQTAGLALAAFQPRLIYMSAMATNDALVYFFGAATLYALLRAVTLSTQADGARPDQRIAVAARRLGWWALAGVAVALGLWTKAYAIVLLPLVAVIPAVSLLPALRPARSRLIGGAATALAIALLLGSWHYVRMYQRAGSPLASNVELRPHNLDRMYPGSVRDLSFFSFRLPALVARPWVHLDTVGSFWTSVYAELWFDYGTSSTVYSYKPWLAYVWPIWRDPSLAPRERERRGLVWDCGVMPGAMTWQARAIYVLALPVTIAVIAGLAYVLVRRWRDPAALVAAALFLTGVAVPLQQTLRVPIRSSMKASYGLFAVGAMVLLFAWLTQALGTSRAGRVLRLLLAANLVLLACAVVWHFVDLSLVFPYTSDYFARRDPW